MRAAGLSCRRRALSTLQPQEKAFRSGAERTAWLRKRLERPEILVMPCAYDGLTAGLVEKAEFETTFVSGFSVSASRGFPDCQLVSYAEMLEAARSACAATRHIPVMCDGDTGYGNAMNVHRTVAGYAQVGVSAVMIEDQVSPKRCGHTQGKAVVPRDEAFARVQAAVDARDEGADILILARTDANTTHGLDEAIERCQRFRELGADITFLEAPTSEEQMRRYCEAVDGPKLANMLEGGHTPVLPPAELQALGYGIVAYPLTLLSASIAAMKRSLGRLRAGEPVDDLLTPWPELRREVGFDDYYRQEGRYAAPRGCSRA
jgi:2-methylisocitrate lyase-like PEP mutase family enzyme|eukprot:COSAG02_NODE_11109_length_1791_cov_2.784279_1_plen_319_part_00